MCLPIRKLIEKSRNEILEQPIQGEMKKKKKLREMALANLQSQNQISFAV